MNVPSLLLQAIALFLFAVGAAAFTALVKGCFVLRRVSLGGIRSDGTLLLKSPLVPAVSVITAPGETSARSLDLVRRLLDLHSARHEVVLVLDEPSQADLDVWIREFRLFFSASRLSEGTLQTPKIRGVYESPEPLHLVLVDMSPGSRSDALNAGVNQATAPIVALIDPEGVFEATILLTLIRPILEDPARTTAVCGVMPPPEVQGLSGRFGALETLRVWLARCAAFSGWNALVPVPGTSLLVTREAIVNSGGFRGGPMELFLHLQGLARQAQKTTRVAFVPAGVSYDRSPASWADLRIRVTRDQREIARAIGHRQAIAGGWGAIGWGLPGLFCVRCLRPLLETAAYLLAVTGWILGFIDLAGVGFVLLATVGVGIVISMATVVLSEMTGFGSSDPSQLTRLFLASIPENLGYRQVRNLWLIAGFFSKSDQKQNRGSGAMASPPAVSVTTGQK